MNKTEYFFRSLLTKRGSTKFMSLYYLVSDMGEYFQLEQLARLIGCHHGSVRTAMEPLQESKIWKKYIESKKIGTAVLYRAIEGKPTNPLRKFIRDVKNEYGE